MNKKRLIALVLAVVLIVSLIAGVLPAVSAAGEYTISLRDGSNNSSATVNAGDTITLYLKLSNNPGIISAGAEVEYPSVLSLSAKPSSVSLDFEPNWQFSSALTKNPYLIWMNVPTGTDEGKLVKHNGSIRKLTFKVSENADSGTYEIKLKAPADKNLTAETDGSGVIKPNTNKKISASVSGFKVTVKSAVCDHNWGAWTKESSATCDKAGKEVRECSVCHKKEDRLISATGHSFNAWAQSKAPSCTVAGEEKRTCQNTGCNKVETRSVKALGHKMPTTWTQTKAPSCTVAGEEKRSCQNSGCTYEEKRAVKALGHNFTNPTVTKEPTCTTTGVKSGKCTRCNKETTQSIPSTGHSYGKWTVTKEPTCTVTGVKTSICTKCNAEKTEKVAATGHKFSAPKITKQPTCTEPGEATGKCDNCKKNTKEAVPPTGHKYGEAEVTLEATCTVAGTKTQTCEFCKGVITEEIPALGHEFGEEVIKQEATLTTPGIVEQRCVRCEEVQQTETPCKMEDTATGIVMEADKDVFQSGTLVTVTAIAQETDAYEAIKKVMADVTSKFVAFDMNAVLDGAQVEPNGTVKAKFPIPAGFSTNLALYYLSEDGQKEFVHGVISEDGKSLEVELRHLSTYALCDLDAKPDNAVDMKQIYILVIGVAGAMLLGIVVFIIVLVSTRKKKEQL